MLTLVYEHLRVDLAPQVARVAVFMGIAADAALLELATRQADFDFMAAHKEQFSDEIIGIPHRLLLRCRVNVGYEHRVESPTP